MTPVPTEAAMLEALWGFLMAVLPNGTEVIKGQVNRVPEPKSANFVIMTPMRMQRLSTNVRSGELVVGGNQASIAQSIEHVIQLDVHGPASAGNAIVISTLLRDAYAVDFFAAGGSGVVPLYADDARQAPFVNGEQQYEYRWVVEAHLQVDETITIADQFADNVDVTLIEVDATYPPT